MQTFLVAVDVLLTFRYDIVDDSHTKSELNETSEMIYLKKGE